MAHNMNHTLAPGTVLKGKEYTYTIRKVLGQGAFGITYLVSTAVPGPLGTVDVQMALKEFFSKELDSRNTDGTVKARTADGIAHRYAQAFIRESMNLSRMKHPGIVNVLEAFEANGTYYYSMAYLAGGNLDEKVKGKGIPEEEAVRLIGQIGEALSYMHDRKMMHLDLKPKNIMLKDDGSPVIIDFGLSKQYDDNGEPESSSSIGLGTLGYAPLEQSSESQVRSFRPTLDIYALGATFYKMLAGVTPPSASTVMVDGLPENDLKAKGISPKTIEAVQKAMRPNWKERPQTVSEFLSMLEDDASMEIGVVLMDPEEDETEKEEAVVRETVKTEQEKRVGRSWLWIIPVLCACCAFFLARSVIRKSGNTSEQDTLRVVEAILPTEKNEVENYRVLDSAGTLLFVYSGTMKNGSPDGFGKAVYPDGREYEGGFVKGKRESEKARFVFSDGNVFEGSFVNDQIGTGRLTSKQPDSYGTYFDGAFKNDKPYQGTWYDKNGTIISVTKLGL